LHPGGTITPYSSLMPIYAKDISAVMRTAGPAVGRGRWRAACTAYLAGRPFAD
jgi:hypothetical protein